MSIHALCTCVPRMTCLSSPLQAAGTADMGVSQLISAPVPPLKPQARLPCLPAKVAPGCQAPICRKLIEKTPTNWSQKACRGCYTPYHTSSVTPNRETACPPLWQEVQLLYYWRKVSLPTWQQPSQWETLRLRQREATATLNCYFLPVDFHLEQPLPTRPFSL